MDSLLLAVCSFIIICLKILLNVKKKNQNDIVKAGEEKVRRNVEVSEMITEVRTSSSKVTLEDPNAHVSFFLYVPNFNTPLLLGISLYGLISYLEKKKKKEKIKQRQDLFIYIGLSLFYFATCIHWYSNKSNIVLNTSYTTICGFRREWRGIW